MAIRQKDCVFCKIVSGEIASRKLYEDETSFSFLDIYPAAVGHALVISKNHYATLLDIPEIELKELIRVVQKIAAAAMKATKAGGFNIVQNNGQTAGQAIHHLHFHIVPRIANDKVGLSFGLAHKAEEKELRELEEKIISHF